MAPKTKNFGSRFLQRRAIFIDCGDLCAERAGYRCLYGTFKLTDCFKISADFLIIILTLSILLEKRQRDGFGLMDAAGNQLLFSDSEYIKGQTLKL